MIMIGYLAVKYSSMRKNNLVGQLLVANPLNPKDGLDHSVILVVSHSPSGSIGLRINSPAKSLQLKTVFDQLGLFYDGNEPVYHAGHLSMQKIHMIHSLDWQGMTTVVMAPNIGITSDVSVLTAICRGEGPEYFRACAGTLAWDEGSLDQQLDPRADAAFKWELAPANINTVFESDSLDQWHKCVEASAKDQVSKWLNLFQD
jgi:putative transcriptional regulator